MAANEFVWEKHPGKAKKGKGSAKGAVFDPQVVLPSAPQADDIGTVNRPRPSTTRYPFDDAAFAALEAKAAKQKPPKKNACEIVADKGKKEEMADTPGMMATGPMVSAPAGPPPSAPINAGNFQGIGATGWLPPDCTMAVGPEHVMLAVNASFVIYHKNGAVAQPAKTLASWFANVITNAKIFDPKALYDQNTGRWFLLTVALPSDQTKQESYFLLSVSQTGNPLGQWWNYKLDAKVDGSTATNNWADYPCLGVDSHAIILTANMFKFGAGFSYAKIRVLNKTPLLTGAAATWFDFFNLKDADGGSSFTVQPCHTFGAPQSEYLVNSYSRNSLTQNKLTLWTLNNTGATPALLKATVTTDPYGQPPAADQKGGNQGLNSGDVRILNAVFRGGSIWASLTTFHNWQEPTNRAAAHWFQINPSNGAIIQQGVFGSKGFHYFYPAVIPDSNGNMTMVFSRCGPSEFASIRYSGRKASDPVGTLQGSALLKAGLANYVATDGSGRNRWGDYAGIAVDPANPLQTWFYSMYAETGNHWGTWVGTSHF